MSGKLAARVIGGRFEIVGAFGGGLLGRDPEGGGDVLVESIPAASARPMLARVEAVSGPGVCRLRATIADGERLWVATELPDAVPRTLAARVADDGPLDETETRALVADVAGALDRAHRHGLVHGRLGAGSIVQADEGHWAVLDLVGTVLARGRAAADERDDVAGLGAIVHHALTGEPPFAVSLDGLAPGMRAPLLRCLQADPGRRYGTVREAATALGVTLPPPPPRRRSRLPWIAAGAMIVVAGGLWLRSQRTTLPLAVPALASSPAAAPAPRRDRPRISRVLLDAPSGDAWLGHALPELLAIALEEVEVADFVDGDGDLKLLGGVTRDGDLLWIDVRVVERATGAYLFAERVAVPSVDALVPVVEGLAARLRSELAPGAAAPPPLSALATANVPALRAWGEGVAATDAAVAEQAYMRAIAADDGFALARVALARAQLAAGKPAVAREALAGIDTPRAGVRARLARAVLLAETPDEAVQAWNDVRARFPADPGVASGLASAYRRAGKPAECVRAAESVTPPPPDLPWCRLEAGDPAGALATARAAGQRLAWGDLALMQGRYAEAREAYAGLPEPLARARTQLVAVHAIGRCRIVSPLPGGWDLEIAQVRAAAALACGEWPTLREVEQRARRAGETTLADELALQLAAARGDKLPPAPALPATGAGRARRLGAALAAGGEQPVPAPIDRHALFDPPLLLAVARARAAAGDVESAALACAEVRAAAPAYTPALLCDGWVAEARGDLGAAFRAYRDFMDRFASADPENRLYREAQRRLAQVVRRARAARAP